MCVMDKHNYLFKSNYQWTAWDQRQDMKKLEKKLRGEIGNFLKDMETTGVTLFFFTYRDYICHLSFLCWSLNEGAAVSQRVDLETTCEFNPE